MFKKLLSVFLLLFASSCATPDGDGRRVSVGYLLHNCGEFLNKTIEVEAYYLGWDCPPDCGAPPSSRSDSCISDGSGCIYLMGTGGLDPIFDRGRKFLIEAVVLAARGGGCYLKVLSVKPLEN